jgi:hypothetical protein
MSTSSYLLQLKLTFRLEPGSAVLDSPNCLLDHLLYNLLCRLDVLEEHETNFNHRGKCQGDIVTCLDHSCHLAHQEGPIVGIVHADGDDPLLFKLDEFLPSVILPVLAFEPLLFKFQKRQQYQSRTRGVARARTGRPLKIVVRIVPS